MQKNPKAERFAKRSFTWGIRSTDMAFRYAPEKYQSVLVQQVRDIAEVVPEVQRPETRTQLEKVVRVIAVELQANSQVLRLTPENCGSWAHAFTQLDQSVVGVWVGH